MNTDPQHLYAGVDVNGRHELGWAPLHIAAVNCRREVGRMRIPGTYTNTTFGLYFFSESLLIY